LGRRRLLNRDGPFDTLTALGRDGTMELISLACQSFNFTTRAFPDEMKSRGFERISDPGGPNDPLPGFLYRDYDYLVWDAIESYVRSVVEKNYGSDLEVSNDVPIQRWAQETSDPNLGNVRGFPDRIESRGELIHTVTNFIFTASAQHSAVNFGQFDFYGFVPNKPMRLTLPMPLKPNVDINWNYVMRALPDEKTTVAQIAVTTLLSMRTGDDLFDHFTKVPGAKDVVGDLLKDALEIEDPYWRPEFREEWLGLIQHLGQAQRVMHERNTKHGYHYNYLMFNVSLAMSIAI